MTSTHQDMTCTDTETLKKKISYFAEKAYSSSIMVVMSSQRAGSAGQAHYSCIMGACVSSAASGKPCLFLYESTKRHLPPPFFLILTTRVRTKTMSNALSSVERQSCIWKPTNVQISHTPPSRCLTFRFGR